MKKLIFDGKDIIEDLVEFNNNLATSTSDYQHMSYIYSGGDKCYYVAEEASIHKYTELEFYELLVKIPA